MGRTPLQIAEIRAGEGYGRIGLTFCPGKKQTADLTSSWERDVGIDVESIRQWGAAVVITLVEKHELMSLGVARLGDETERRHLQWLHLPIADVSIAGPGFERAWD